MMTVFYNFMFLFVLFCLFVFACFLFCFFVFIFTIAGLYIFVIRYHLCIILLLECLAVIYVQS